MSEQLYLVKDLAVILIAAGFFTILSKALKQPLILGYIIAGFVVGPHLGLIKLTSTEAVHQWSEIGIIFLLFALGLEFSFKKLLKVGSGAMTMAGVKCVGMFVVGILLGKIMGWSTMEGIFLGGLLSMSSTTVIIKSYDDMGLKNKPYAPLIFGSLVVEDLIAVLLMVLLSTLAVSGRFEGGKMAIALLRLVFFLVIWFLVGIYLIPTVLRKIKKLLNDETLLIVAIGLCFLMVAIADSVGFSAALGAFVMGSILAETLEGERIEHLLSQIKDLFGAIFFVSVGMMVDPVVIGQQWLPITLITVFAMAGILLFSSAGALISGAGLETAVHAGFSLAQLGEFAFIIAALGCNMGVMRDFIYPVIIAVSVITTFTTPYMIRAAEPVSRWLNRVLPASFISRVNRSTTDDFSTRSEDEGNHWKIYVQKYGIRVAMYTILLVAILIASDRFSDMLSTRFLPDLGQTARDFIEAGITFLVMTPFLSGLLATGPRMKAERAALQQQRHANGAILFTLEVIRVLIAIAIVVELFTERFDVSWPVLLMLLVVSGIAFLLLRKLFRERNSFELQFFSNLDANEELERRRAPVTAAIRENLDRYNVHIEAVTLSPDSPFAGQPLRMLPYRGKGANILKIKRGSRSILIPDGDTPIYPYDTLLAVGTDDQIAAFHETMDGHLTDVRPRFNEEAGTEEEPFVVRPVEVTPASVFCGKSLRELQMRSAGCAVICYLRDGRLVANPSPDDTFAEGDLVWTAGEIGHIDDFLASDQRK